MFPPSSVLLADSLFTHSIDIFFYPCLFFFFLFCKSPRDTDCNSSVPTALQTPLPGSRAGPPDAPTRPETMCPRVHHLCTSLSRRHIVPGRPAVGGRCFDFSEPTFCSLKGPGKCCVVLIIMVKTRESSAFYLFKDRPRGGA